MVYRSLGESRGYLTNYIGSHKPPHNGWKYAKGGAFSGDDSSLTLEFTTLSSCQLVKVAGEGDVSKARSESLGYYR